MLLESIAGAAIAAITPFLVKGGEAIATGVGKSLWKTIKNLNYRARPKAN